MKTKSSSVLSCATILFLLLGRLPGHAQKSTTPPPVPMSPSKNTVIPAPGAPLLVRERKFGASGTIPRGYKTFSLFLVCNPSWAGTNKYANLATLYDKFMIFGSAIGDANLAVWFWKGDAQHSLFLGTGDHVDVARSLAFCSAWHLVPSGGPYIVVTSTYPDEDRLKLEAPKEDAVLSLEQMSGFEIGTLLDGIATGLKINQGAPAPSSYGHGNTLRTYPTQANAVDGTAETVDSGQGNALPDNGQQGVSASSESSLAPWERLLSSVQRIINRFGCAWAFKVDAGPVKADLHSCKQQASN